MNEPSFIGERVIWLLGSLLLGCLSLIVGKFVGGKDKVDKDTCDERRSACVMLTNNKLDALHEQVTRMNKNIDKLIDRK